MSPEKAVRTAGALELNDYSPDADSPLGYIDIEAFQQVQYARFPGNSAAHVAKREWVDEHLDQIFNLAVGRVKTLKQIVLLLGKWIVSSVDPSHATAMFGTYYFTQIYEKVRAIQVRFQSSDRHGVIYCINKLMTVKMKDETVVGAHTFTDDVSSLMLRLKGHLREGGQESKKTYQSVHWEDEGELEEDSQTQDRGHNTGRGRGRGRGRGYNKRNFRQNKNSNANSVRKIYDDEEAGSE